MTFESRHISQPIQLPPAVVAEFVGDPRNLPQWAEGLSTGIRQDGERWVADSPLGQVEVRFRPGIEHGVLDHDVLLPDGSCVHNPMRVIANGPACEVVFTLFRLPHVSEDDYEADAAMIREDLARLRDLLESAA